ncbi:methylated-DNA--protein-cysteine methyltransferase isoform X3 [Scyliorhinus torazame]|uniref:methylated-DNA--protein-cysteine methyltransferase isoform X3 n=1 Tax=Scyliorhinus torazame TaxID=75743 RepID=UPI003B5C8A79
MEMSFDYQLLLILRSMLKMKCSGMCKRKLLHMANMAARLHQKVAKKKNTSHCKQVTAALQSPIGTIQVSGCEEGIHSIELQEGFVPKDRTRVASFTCEVCESQEEMTAPLKYCMTWLQAYFSERWTTEKLPLPAFHHPIFEQDPTEHLGERYCEQVQTTAQPQTNHCLQQTTQLSEQRPRHHATLPWQSLQDVPDHRHGYHHYT